MPNLIYEDAGSIAVRFGLDHTQTSSSTMFVFSLRENNDAMHLVRQPDGRYVFEIIDAEQPYYYGSSYELELGYLDDADHIVVVNWDADSYTVYLDGVLVGSVEGHVDWTGAYDLVVGSRHDTLFPYAGIDWAEVSDTALSAETIALQVQGAAFDKPFNHPLSTGEISPAQGTDFDHEFNETFSERDYGADPSTALGTQEYGTTAYGRGSAGLVTVGVDFGVGWEVLTPVAKEVTGTWNVNNKVTKDFSPQWENRIPVASAFQVIWSASDRNPVGKSVGLLWNESAPVAKDLNADWSILANVGINLEQRWAVLRAVGNETDLAWATRNKASRDFAFPWIATTSVTVSLNFPWSEFERVGSQTEILWNAAMSVDLALNVTTKPGLGYAIDVLYDRPAAYWRLDDLADSMGGANLGGTLVATKTIVSGEDPAAKLNNSALTTTLDDLFQAGNEKQFTIEAWVRAQPTTAGVFVGRNDEGLYADPTGLGFKAGGQTIVVPVTDWTTKHHLVATYSEGVVTVYVDGISQASATLPITTITNEFKLGHNSFIGDLQHVAVYRSILGPFAILRHYERGTRAEDYDRAVMASEPVGYWKAETVNRSQSITVDTLTDATAGPYSLDETGIAGGSKIVWWGAGTVEVSLDDGDTWQAAANNYPVPGIGAGTDITATNLMLRSTGTVVDLAVDIYAAPAGLKSETGIADALLVGTPTTGNSKRFNADQQSGVVNYKQGMVLLPEHTFQTVEFWVNPYYYEAATLERFLDVRATPHTYISKHTNGTTLTVSNVLALYINGVDRTGTANMTHIPVGEWSHFVVVLPAPVTYVAGLLNREDVQNIGLAARIDHIATYAGALPLETAMLHYDLGSSGLRSIMVPKAGQPIKPVEQGYTANDHVWQVSRA